jgi:hypothetical protein
MQAFVITMRESIEAQLSASASRIFEDQDARNWR